MQNKLLFHVEGIRCHSCIQKIENALMGFDAIDTANIRMDNSVLEITGKDFIEPETIKTRLFQLGFPIQLINNKAEQYDFQKIQNRKFLNKIAVAGFCAGNIMLFTVSIYAGADKLYLQYFSWISVILFLPILFYSATDFYRNALTSIKNKYLSIDLPITIALVGGFSFSLLNLYFKKYDSLYFDSTASFIFLILIVRYFLGKLQQQLFFVENPFQIDESKKYQVGDISKRITELQASDIITVKKNELIPVDCILLDKYAEVNTSLLSGESYPKLYQQDMMIPSGSLNISSEISVKVVKNYQHSYLPRLLEKIDIVKNEKGPTVQLADKASHYLVLIVFLIALINFAIFIFIDPLEGFQRSLALIIVACPCALALGTPLAYAIGVQKAKKLGIWVKNQKVFDQILEVKNLFFDKTGTLTNGKISITNPSENVDPKIIQIALNLEKISYHPIAYAIREKWGREFENLDLKEHREIAGEGVSAIYNNDLYELQRSKDNKNEIIKAELRKNNELIYEFSLEDKLKNGTPIFLNSLKSQFKNIFLVSGDNSRLVNIVGKTYGIDENKIFSNLNPQQKLELIKRFQPAMMVGDGINDALSLKEASVGIAVHGAVAQSLESADIYLVKNDLDLIHQFINLSQKVRKTLLSNLKLSFLYNFIAGLLSLSGFINPLVAAILMPISSIAIILNTYRRLK